MPVRLNINKLFELSPKGLMNLKDRLIKKLRFEDAEFVDSYIRHCKGTDMVVKKILNV